MHDWVTSIMYLGRYASWKTRRSSWLWWTSAISYSPFQCKTFLSIIKRIAHLKLGETICCKECQGGCTSHFSQNLSFHEVWSRRVQCSSESWRDYQVMECPFTLHLFHALCTNCKFTACFTSNFLTCMGYLQHCLSLIEIYAPQFFYFLLVQIVWNVSSLHPSPLTLSCVFSSDLLTFFPLLWKTSPEWSLCSIVHEIMQRLYSFPHSECVYTNMNIVSWILWSNFNHPEFPAVFLIFMYLNAKLI